MFSWVVSTQIKLLMKDMSGQVYTSCHSSATFRLMKGPVQIYNEFGGGDKLN